MILLRDGPDVITGQTVSLIPVGKSSIVNPREATITPPRDLLKRFR